MVPTPTSRSMRTGKPKKRPKLIPSLIGCPYLAKGVSLDPRAAIRSSAMVTAAGTAICAQPSTTPAFIMSAPAWKRPLRTSWMTRGQLMLCSFRNTVPIRLRTPFLLIGHSLRTPLGVLIAWITIRITRVVS